jgi:hypothetical protein
VGEMAEKSVYHRDHVSSSITLRQMLFRLLFSFYREVQTYFVIISLLLPALGQNGRIFMELGLYVMTTEAAPYLHKPHFPNISHIKMVAIIISEVEASLEPRNAGS